MTRVFISYSSNNVAFVQMLASSFRLSGIAYWWDIERKEPGAIWDDVIHEALCEAERLVVVVTPESMASDEVGAEWKYAITRGIPVIPLYLRDADMHYRLSRYNYIDFRTSYQEGIDQLIPYLKQPVEARPEQPVPTSPQSFIEDLRSDNWHIRRDAVDTLLKMAAGAGIFATLQLGANILQTIVRALELHADEEERPALREHIQSELQQLSPPTARPARGRKPRVQDILPPPFDWCDVPAGEFIYGAENVKYAAPRQKLKLPAFAIAKYPITYRQFQVFLDARDGFRDKRWWNGLAAKADHRKTPGDQEWKINDHPREHVSWYDAIAFCRWLSFRLGGGYDIDRIDDWLVRLPTEFEWEKAARGTDGRLYPWGNEFDKSRCNTPESGISMTTPVTQYPQGKSPYGALDMAGNVWEWCLTDNDKPTTEASEENIRSDARRVLRGGSWFFDLDLARAVYRFSLDPAIRDDSVGFRVCVNG